MKKEDKVRIYIESFLMTSMLGITLFNSRDLDGFGIPSVSANANMVTLNDTSSSIEIEVVDDEDIVTKIRKAVDSKMDELEKNKNKSSVVGTVTPISNDQLEKQTTEDILNNQFEELANSILDEEMNKGEYSGMKLPHELENYIKQTCMKYSVEYGIDYNRLYKTVMTIGYVESAGEWNNDGVRSSTNDYGVMQINGCNAKEAYNNHGYTLHDLQYNAYANIDYGTDKICQIMSLRACKSDKDVYGIWNGWVTWKNKPSAVNYANACMEIQGKYFNNYVNNIIR